MSLDQGDRFEFLAWQRDRDRLNDWYHSRGFLEARIRARRLAGEAPPVNADPGQQRDEPVPITLEYSIERGPLTRLDVRGVDLPEDVRSRIRSRWSTAVFDGFLERDARAIVREHLFREGRLQATVVARVSEDASADSKTLTIEAQPGEFLPRRLEFAGNELVPSARLYAAAEQAGGLAAWIDPASLERAIERVYLEQGLLLADAEVPAPFVKNGIAIARVVIREGDPFRVGKLALQGVPSIDGNASELPGLTPGSRYQPQAIRDASTALEGRLRKAGFLEARVEIETRVDADAGRVDVDLRAVPGARSVLADVIVEGGDAKKPRVARAIALETGAPIDPAAIATTRKQLYDTGAYRSVDLTLEPRDGIDRGGSAAGGDRAVVARLRLEERPRYRFRYGLALNDDVVSGDERERRLGFAADFEDRNLFGLGAIAGVSARLRRDQEIGRLFLGANRFIGLPLRSTLFLQRDRRTFDSDGVTPIVGDETEISAEQAYRLRHSVELRYGYALGRNRTFIEGQDFDVRVRVARLFSSAFVDRRRNPFDPLGGWFGSGSFELSRPGLGSDLSFLNSFFQYFRYDSIREGTILASAARVGLARTFDDQDLIFTERFYAGGATTVRGFREDDLGPRGGLGGADGGGAVLIFNEELRFPLYRWLRGVGFVDVGNVYPSPDDLTFSDLLVGAGAGIRIDSPIGIIRLDFAMPVNGRPFDPKWRFHIGLGHTF